jgi:DNA-binding NtrC family response regulator
VKKFKGHKVVSQKVDLIDPIDVEELCDKVNSLLESFKNDEVDIFVSTGSPNMRVAWFLTSVNFKRNVSLFQVRQSKDTAHKKTPEKVPIKLDTKFSPLVFNASVESLEKTKSENEIFKTKRTEIVYQKANAIAKSNSKVSCLILGDNGTGKEHLAKSIHDLSNREGKFIPVNCSAFSDDLLRSELFGHEKNSFTGANDKKIGLFEEADNGTIFLDEIGDISQKMQVSLLRILQTKKFQRVGGTKEISVDVRVIAATNKDLETLSEKGDFRLDLFHRLAVTTLNLPSLHEWTKDELKKLIDHLNKYLMQDYSNRNEPLIFSKEVINHLATYRFPGNIRELQNLIMSLYTLCDSEVNLSDLPDRIRKVKVHPTSKDEFERASITQEFERHNQNIVRTAKALKMHRDTLKRKLVKYGLRNANE